MSEESYGDASNNGIYPNMILINSFSLITQSKR